MKKALNYFMISVITILLLNGCIHRELIISGPNSSGANDESQNENNSTMVNGIIPRASFPSDEYKVLKKTGSSTIKGSIYIADAYGKKIYGKNTRLYLNPVTSYSKQWYTESYIGGYKMEKADKRLFNYLKFTASNTKGNFAFFGVPDGSYYVIGMVKCGSECGYDEEKNIRIAKEVSVSGSSVEVIELNRMID